MKKKGVHQVLRMLSVTALTIGGIVLCVFARGLNAQDILRYTPENPILAASVITLMTAAASMIPVFPMMIFYFACGMLFPFGWAMFVGAVGILAEAIIQYGLGRRLGASYVDGWIAKYPKLSIIRTWQTKNDIMLTYLLRISGLPVNLVSLLLGAMGVKSVPYLIGTYIGMLPGLISCILIGVQVKQTFTWQLVLAIVIINAASVGVAFLVNRLVRRGNR